MSNGRIGIGLMEETELGLTEETEPGLTEEGKIGADQGNRGWRAGKWVRWTDQG